MIAYRLKSIYLFSDVKPARNTWIQRHVGAVCVRQKSLARRRSDATHAFAARRIGEKTLVAAVCVGQKKEKNMRYIEPLAKLISSLTKLPGVGEKTAARYAYSILNGTNEDADALIEAIREVKDRVHFCKVCGNFTENDECDICRDRRSDTICVVKEPKDIGALEKAKGFKGVYHVLHGVINPMENIGPDDIRIKELLSRLTDVKEVIIATNPDIEGEATAMYIARLIKPLGIKVTRLAQGLPSGSVIEYADEHTLSQALSLRVEL